MLVALAALGPCGQGANGKASGRSDQPRATGTGVAPAVRVSPGRPACRADREGGGNLLQGEPSTVGAVLEWQRTRYLAEGGLSATNDDIAEHDVAEPVAVCAYQGEFPYPGPGAVENRQSRETVGIVVVFADGSQVMERVGPKEGFNGRFLPSDSVSG